MANFSLVYNSSAASAQSKLSGTGNSLNQTLSRLSSGLRINKSGDDAAGLAIANTYRSDVSVLSQGVRNANDGLSTLQIVDGGLNTISNLLDRASTLATQSASGTFTGDRTTLSAELTSVVAEIDRQAQNIGLATLPAVGPDIETARFAKVIDTYVGGGAQASSTGNVVSVDLSTSEADSTGLGVAALDISTEAAAKTSITTIRDAVKTLGTIQGTVGAGQNNLSQAIDLASAQITNYKSAESSIRDADIATEASNLARLNTLQQAGFAALSQANQSSQAVLSLLR